MGARTAIKQFLLAHVGQVVTAKQIHKASGVTEWARRVRELRGDDGWKIITHYDDCTLKPGEYILTEVPPIEGYQFAKPISARLRAQVLERNGYTCKMCGAAAGDEDENSPGRRVRLHIGHIVDRSHGGKVELSNLQALCASCNQGAKNLTPEPPRWTWLLAQLRRASINDQQAALKWLTKKFRKTPTQT